MTETTTPLLLSLKPCYADMVFHGLKKAELRRRIASYVENRDVFVYVSSPKKEMRGGFRVGQVWTGAPEYVWQFVSNLARVKKREFDSYFSGCEVAFALEITEVWEYGKPVPLEFLRQRLGEFVVPQSWRYLRDQEQKLLTRVGSVEGTQHLRFAGKRSAKP